MLSLPCRVRMPESLAGNDLNARAKQQGRTGEGEEEGWKGRGPSVGGKPGGGRDIAIVSPSSRSGPGETMTPVLDLFLLSVPDTHESRDMRRLSLRSVALIWREREGRGQSLTG